MAKYTGTGKIASADYKTVKYYRFVISVPSIV